MVENILKKVEETCNIEFPEMYVYNTKHINKMLIPITLFLFSEDNIVNRLIAIKDKLAISNRMVFNHKIFIEIYNLYIVRLIESTRVNDDKIKLIKERYISEQIIEFSEREFLDIFKGEINSSFFYEYKKICLYNIPACVPGERYFSESKIYDYILSLEKMIDEYNEFLHKRYSTNR